ncbi:MAG: hypothetical protein INF93_02955 [Rhodobacter sp.]|jgi:hypothetical protein|nr:hypothetical protein [Rhodobacter sp.]
MSVAKWATPSARSANLAGTALNSLANGSESAFVAYNNSSNLDLYAAVTVKLGSLNAVAGGSVTLRIYAGDGTDTPDRGAGSFDTYTEALTTGTSAKVVVFRMVRLYPFPCQITVVNNAGNSTAASGNELYVRPFNEDVT